MHIPAASVCKAKKKTVLWFPTFHSSLDHSIRVQMRDRSLENRQGSQPALTGAALTSGQLGWRLCPSRIGVDWLDVPVSAKSDSQLGYTSHVSVPSGQEACLSGRLVQAESLGTWRDFHLHC